MWYVIFALVFGLMYRWRGGGFFPTHHTQWTRAIYAVVWSAILALFIPWDWAVAAAPLVFLGELAGQGEGMWMGRDAFHNSAWTGWKNWVRAAFDLSASGCANILGVSVILLLTGYHSGPLALAGICKPVAYEIAQHIPSKIKNFNSGPEIGEFLFGVMEGIGLALCLT